MRSDPKPPPIPLPAMWEVRDPAARNLRAAVTNASGKPSRCDQLLRRSSWQTDDSK
jgi:hypothetical protein